ncbi:MAG: MFS transporter [Alphaproteobacteria bacterium]|nr:MFS transporter [Alphaproteobacteria bacterium]
MKIDTAEKPTRVRYLMLAMMFVTVVINYLDRNNISTTVSAIKAEFGIDNARMGLILGAFGWTYALFQIPGGWLVDRMTPRLLLPIILILWSVATLSTSLASTVAAFFIIRLMVGLLEAPAYSIFNQVTTAWFPNRERATAVGTFISAQFLGPAFITGLLVLMVASFGWRSVFYVTGGAGVVWGIIWYLVYRGPRESKLANQAELNEIEAGGAILDFGRIGQSKTKFTWADFLTVFKYRKLWGIYIGQFTVTSSQFFFFTWFPTYLAEYRHLSVLKTGIYASLPFAGAWAGALCSGFFSDALLKRGFTLGTARKTPIIMGLLISSTIVMANFVESPELAVVFFTISLFGNGLASIGWSLISSAAPRRLIGLTGGAFNGISNLSGIVTPIIIGYLAENGNFAPGLVYIGCVALVGVFAYVTMIGKLEPVEP